MYYLFFFLFSKMVVFLFVFFGFVSLGKFYLILILFYFVFMVNGINMIDGFDGLVGGIIVLVFIGMLIVVFLMCFGSMLIFIF